MGDCSSIRILEAKAHGTLSELDNEALQKHLIFWEMANQSVIN